MVRRLFEQYKEVFDQMVEKIICHRLILMYETLGCNMELVPEEDREEVETVVDNLGRYKVSAEFVKQRKVWIDNLVKVKTQLEQYIRSMVCLGFNSAKYDMKIIAPYMIPLMLGECREFLEHCHCCLYSPPQDWHGQQHRLGDYTHLNPEVVPDAGDIQVIKQHGGYTAFSWCKLLEFKDVYRFC